MTPEDIARQHENLHGYELIDYAPVALPVYRLTVDAVTMVHQALPPMREFVMRSIATGLTFEDEISGFLGLDAATVQSTISQIKFGRLATVDEDNRLSLTDHGISVLEKAYEAAPQDEMLVFLYDRLLRHPVRYETGDLLAPGAIDSLKVIEIRPYPAEGPEVQELKLPETLQVLEKEVGGRKTFGRDLLRLKKIVRRARMFRPGVALVYKKNRSTDIHISFFVDDTRQEEIEHAFTIAGGAKKMGFVKSIDASSTWADLRKHIGLDHHKSSLTSEDLLKARAAVSLARLRHQVAVGRSRHASLNQDEQYQNEDSIKDSADGLVRAEVALATFPIRPAAPYEMAEYLANALRTCTRRLMISSKNVDKSHVDETFLNQIRKILAKGVEVTINLTDSVGDERAAVELEKLKKKYNNLQLNLARKSPFYYVICDDIFSVVTNKPFLSNIGKVRTFYSISGYVLQESGLVDAYAERVKGLAIQPEQLAKKKQPVMPRRNKAR